MSGMWRVTCWNEIIRAGVLLMEGSGSVLGFHQELFSVSKESWIFGVSE